MNKKFFVITKTPLRISFFGGGTDFKDFYKKYGGKIIGTTIDKYIYQSFRFIPDFGASQHRIVWRHVELVNTISEILHPSVREGLKFLDFKNDKCVEIHYQADIPARTGMGSSSSFVVGLLNGLSALKGSYLDKKTLSDLALELEQSIMKEHVGSQDQVAAAFGGLNIIEFNKDVNYRVKPIELKPHIKDNFLSHLLLVYTGSGRFSSEITKNLIKNLPKKSNHIQRIHDIVYEGEKSLINNDMECFGELLDETWQIKTQLSN